MYFHLHLPLANRSQCILLKALQQLRLVIHRPTPQRRSFECQSLEEYLHDVRIRLELWTRHHREEDKGPVSS